MTLLQQIELLQAIESCKTVQWLNKSTGRWLDLEILKAGPVCFRDGEEYRIKPKARVVWVAFSSIRGDILDAREIETKGWTKFVEALDQ